MFPAKAVGMMMRQTTLDIFWTNWVLGYGVGKVGLVKVIIRALKNLFFYKRIIFYLILDNLPLFCESLVPKF